MTNLISSLPVGAKVRFGKHQVNNEAKQDIIWQVGAKNHSGYPGNSVTLVTDKIIDIRGFDAKEPSNSNSDRRSYGNNRYRDSNLRQWLNKAGSPWFEKTHSADEPPTDAGTNNNGTGYDKRDGFLSAFNSDELAAILNTNLTVAKNTVTDGGGVEQVTDKVFLLSNTEVGLANEPSGAEGSKLPLFTDNTSRVGKPTKQAVDNSGYTHGSLNINSGWHWWLRSPNSSSSRNVRSVSSDGSLGSYIAYRGNYGVRPALNLKSDIGVSDNPDSNGVYTLIYNTPPTISGNDEDLGDISDAIVKDYTVFDVDGDKLSIVERLNNKVLNYYNDMQSGTTKTLEITKEKVYDLPIGQENTISIELSDGSATVFRKWTFTRTNTAPIIQLLTESEYGEIIEPFNTKVKISDPELDTVDLKYVVNRIDVDSNEDYTRVPVFTHELKDITLDTELDFEISKEVWNKLLLSNYELHIIATDDQGGESKEVIKFNRTEDEISFTTKAIEKEVKPMQIITLFEISGNPTNTVIEAANNALDSTPVWEDITEEARSGQPYTFTNDTKTAANWGISVRVQIDGKVI